MFTGIVLGTAPVVAIESRTQFRTHTVRLPAAWREGLEVGASVAHNGCCLTVTKQAGENVSFDLIAETLACTNLGALTVGSLVNIERAARFGAEIGGHAMSGHILGTAPIIDILDTPNNRTLWFQLPEALSPYLFTKGYIGIDGCSLTLGEVRGSLACVHLIPETLSRTTLGPRQTGERVNIESHPQTQVIVDTVAGLLAARGVVRTAAEPCADQGGGA